MFKPFNRFARFKPFKPSPLFLPRDAGEDEGGGFELSEAVELLERLELF